MKKRLFCSLASFLLLTFFFSSSFCSLSASADSSEADSATTLTFEQICTALEELTGVDYSDFNYYITRGPVEVYSSQYFRNYSIILCQPDPENEVHIINDNYAENQASNNVKIACTPDLNSTYTAFNFRFGLWHDRDLPDIWGNWESWTRPNAYPETIIHVAESTFFESNMRVYVGDENINEKLFNASISYDSESQEIIYSAENLSEDCSIGVLCGVYDYISLGMASVGAGSDFRRLLSIEPIIQYANDKGEDYSNYTAYLTVYDGIDVVETITFTIGDLVSGVADDVYDEKKPYEPFPDPEDYFDDPPDFPSLDPFPSMPAYDENESLLWNLWELIKWLGDWIVTPIKNIIKILRWIVETIVYYVTHALLFLKDCFLTLVHNIGIALYNLSVDIKALLVRLFVPKKLGFIEKLKEKFPIIWSIKSLFNDLHSEGYQTITISPFIAGESRTMSISCVDALGDSCGAFFNLSRLIISLFGLFSMINIVSNVLASIDLRGAAGGD